MEKKKVFCQECKFFHGYNQFVREFQCDYPDNITEDDDWLSSRTKGKVIPDIINKDNDCKWFEAK